MATYIVRIVLHEATWDHYTDLHAAMAGWLSAQRVIMGDSGKWYDLPDGEYYIQSEEIPERLRDAVVEVATRIKPDPMPSVIVTEANYIAWQLRPIGQDS